VAFAIWSVKPVFLKQLDAIPEVLTNLAPRNSSLF
jgi:hypothetical protein